MIFKDLWLGDRFMAFGTLWTKIDRESARKHSAESRDLGKRGYGYRGDTICSFDSDDKVDFVPPNAELTGARRASELNAVLCGNGSKVGAGDTAAKGKQ